MCSSKYNLFLATWWTASYSTLLLNSFGNVLNCGVSLWMFVNNRMPLNSLVILPINWTNFWRSVGVDSCHLLCLNWHFQLYSRLRSSFGNEICLGIETSSLSSLICLQNAGQEQVFKKTFCGMFADQKICKECNYRWV